MKPEVIYNNNSSIVLVKPIFEPFNEQAEDIVSLLLRRLKLPYSGPKKTAYRTMMASILRAVSFAIESTQKRKRFELGMPVGNDNWTLYPKVGAIIGNRVLRTLETHGYLKRDPRSGRREFYRTKSDKLAYEAIMTLWSIAHSFKAILKDTSPVFIETGRPLVLVSKLETRSEKEARERHHDVKQKLSRPEIAALVGEDALRQQEARIEALSRYWRLHPLVAPDGNAAACVSRVFSDSRLDVGGRLYGAWTNRKSNKRLDYLIDGQPVIQLDISASQPTLLSALLGIPLTGLSPDGGWYDPYTLLEVLGGYLNNRTLSEEERNAGIRRSRLVSKRVVVELIGTGNVGKRRASDELVEDLDISEEEWCYYRDRLVEQIPALSKLEPRFQGGKPVGYINGPAFLSYHESEIMLRCLEDLRDNWDVPAYPVHDCLLVKRDDLELAYNSLVLRACEYIRDVSGTPVIVPVKIEGKEFKTRRIRGVFNSTNPQIYVR